MGGGTWGHSRGRFPPLPSRRPHHSRGCTWKGKPGLPQARWGRRGHQPLELAAAATSRSLAPALAVGNAVLVNPASDTPVTGGLLLAKIFDEAGLPPGVLSVVVGAGAEIGDAFVTHPVPRVISLTGSTPVGRRVARLAADASIMKRLDLELGGNSPFVILNDADLDQAVDAAVFGKFLHHGQICMSPNRFIVDDAIYDAFVEQFGALVSKLKIGDPNKTDTVIGPVINQRQLEGLQERISQARGLGIRQVAAGNAEGLVLPPHVLANGPWMRSPRTIGSLSSMCRGHIPLMPA